MRCSRTGVFLTTALGLTVMHAAAQPSFTADQARAGRTAYRTHCAACHGPELEGIHLSPALTGSRFDEMWRGRKASLLDANIRRMPPEAAAPSGTVSDEDYRNLLAYVLMSNDFEAGDAPLTDDQLSGPIPLLPGQTADPLAPGTRTPEQAERLEKLPPVTQEMLENPAPGDWLQWGRAYNGQHFSPLDQINRENVENLTLAWRRPLASGPNMPTPLVHEGILYLSTFPDTVIAVDGVTGTVLWRHQYNSFGTQKMGIGLHGDKVIMPTSDMHVIALNAKTGDRIWTHQIPGNPAAFRLRSAPLIVGDVVIQGVTASFAAGGGFICGLDANTGDEIWRFYTIARPDEPGGNTWNGLPLEDRSGGSVWHQGTYDPDLNLVYFGIAPTYDTGPLLHSVEEEGVTNDALFTNCTVALRPETGELVWSYQHLANDQWDLDWAFERQIAEIPLNGATRKIVMNTGKIAMLDALDAATGEYLFSVDAGVQNFVLAVDPKTGAKTIDPAKMPDVDRPCVVCPSPHGARSWPPTSYNPVNGMLYLPLNEFCMLLGPDGFKLLTSGVGISMAPNPNDNDGKIGRLQAIDIPNARLAWTVDFDMPVSSGVLATAGGLVFAGDIEPSLKAFDSESGELLWTAGLDDAPSSSIISYAVGDKQYIAVEVGAKNLHLTGLIDGYRTSNPGAEPVHATLTGGPALWVFALN